VGQPLRSGYATLVALLNRLAQRLTWREMRAESLAPAPTHTGPASAGRSFSPGISAPHI